jgi:uncharacterized protein YxjI
MEPSHPGACTMSVVVTCQCSNTFELKDEFAGRMVKCPNCGTDTRAPGEKLTPKSQADPVFDRDVFLLRQKAFAIKEKYAVSDEAGNQILYVERPAHALRNLLATLVAFIAAAVVFTTLNAIATIIDPTGASTAAVIVVLLSFVMAFLTLVVVGVGLSKKRHVTFYRGEQAGEKVLEILQFKKFEVLTATFIIRDAKGHALGKLQKNMLSNILRKKWRLTSLAGRPLLVAQEDSMLLSLLRRVLGPFFGLLRTNFILQDPSGKLVGEFQRKLTILDRYALDMRADANRNIDRRLALAVGVVLDTGEKR